MADNYRLKWGRKSKEWFLIEDGFFHSRTLQSYATKKEALNDVEKLAQRNNELQIVSLENRDGVQTRIEKFKP